MKLKIKILKKFLVLFLVAIILFQPYFAVSILAEGESSEVQIAFESSPSGVDSPKEVSSEPPPEPSPTPSTEPSLTPIPTPESGTLAPIPEESAEPSETEIIPTSIPSQAETQEQKATSSAVIAENKDTGKNSESSASASGEQTTTVINENQLELENTIAVLANSGENTASGSGVMVETGEASVSADLVNVINTNLVGENFWQAIVNLFETRKDDVDLTQMGRNENPSPGLIYVLAANENTGTTSANLALANFLSSLAVYNQNRATLTNNLDLSALSGNNQILGDGGTIKSGTASVSLNLFNLVNTNLLGKNWFFGVINLFGRLEGDIILPYELQFLGENESRRVGVLAINQNTGENSQNQAQASLENTIEVKNTNEANLTNNVSLEASSGGNEIIGADEIQTGKTRTSLNLLNIVNTNIFGNRWLFLLINNFGQWRGNLVGWWGNTNVTPGRTLAWTRLFDEGGGQNVQVKAENENSGENSENQAGALAEISLSVENNNTATVENNISLVADSGGNQIEGKSTQIKTGDAQASANIFNFINTNIAGNHWFFGIINIFDWFWGDIIFPRPDLMVVKTANKETVAPEEEINYTVSYKNQGRLWAKETTIVDTLPHGVNFISASGGGVFEEGKVVWNLGKVWPGQKGSLTLVVKVNADTAEGTKLINNVSISTTTEEPNKGNNSSWATVSVRLLPTSAPSLTPSPSPSPIPSPSLTPKVASSPTPASGGGPSVGGAWACGAATPAPPTLLNAVKTGASASLSWTAVSGITHYSLSYGLSSGNYIYGVSNTGNTTSFTISELDPGSNYCFAVRAVNGCAPGGLSNEICTGVSLGVGQVLGLAATSGNSFADTLFLLGSLCLLLVTKSFLAEKRLI